jgi:hypothetical protein
VTTSLPSGVVEAAARFLIEARVAVLAYSRPPIEALSSILAPELTIKNSGTKKKAATAMRRRLFCRSAPALNAEVYCLAKIRSAAVHPRG